MFDKAIFSLPGARGALAVSAGFALGRAILLVGQAFFLSVAVVSLWEGAEPLSQVPMLFGFFACFMGVHIVQSGNDAYVSHFAARSAADLRTRLLSVTLGKGSGMVACAGSGSVGALALEGIDTVEEYLRLSIPKITALAVVPAVLLVTALVVDWISCLVMALAFPAIILMMVLIGSAAEKSAAARHREFSRLSGHFLDSLRGLSTLQAFGRSASHGESIYAVSERFREATLKTLRIATLSSAVLDFASTMSVAAVAIMLGFRMTAGDIEFLPALFVLVLVPDYFKPIREFAADYHATLEGKNALAAVGEALLSPDLGFKGAAGTPFAEGRGASCGDIASNGPVFMPSAPGIAPARGPIWSGASTLEFLDVGFSYPDHRALEGISFKAQGFQRIGLVGVSGSGKSTLASLVAGFSSPDAGAILIDGHATRLDGAEWRANVLYIPQSPYLFSATLADNIAFYTPNAARADIAQAALAVGLDELLSELPRGLDEPVGDGGRVLSGGEAQRVAFARALLDRSRTVLVFDEPTAHLDIETELELKDRMVPLMEGRLVVFATHRLHWASSFDAVAVMDGGRLVEFGAPDDLVGAGGAFSRLVGLTREGRAWDGGAR